MNKSELADVYRDYIACLNRQDWPSLSRFVHEEVRHNGAPLGLSGYRQMLERDFIQIPDLHFNIDLLIVDPPHVACRIRFNCAPKEKFLGLDVRGEKISFSENVFYEFLDGKIVEVWSVIDKVAIEAQLRLPLNPSNA